MMKRGFDGWLFNGKYNTEVTLALIRYEEKRIHREKRRGTGTKKGGGRKARR
jgi:hypothetical protein